MRPLLAALLGAAALAAAGCGASSSDPPKNPAGPASLAPKDAGAWVAVDTDEGSAQWQSAQALLAKIPGGRNVLDDALGQVRGAKSLDFRRDVQPALGAQLVVVVPAGAQDPVLLAKPDEPEKLGALLAKSTQPYVTGNVDGWTAVATTQKALDAYEAALAKGALANDGRFVKAMDGLPADALVRGYLNGVGLGGTLRQAASGATGALSGLPLAGVGGAKVDPRAAKELGTIGFAVSATRDAFRVDGSVVARGGSPPVSYAPTLLAGVPADALLVVSFEGGESLSQQLGSAAGADALKQLEQQLGVSADDLAGALDGEGVLYVRPGAPIPELTLVVEPKDAARAKQTFDRLVAKLGATQTGGVSIPGLALTTATVDGAVLVSTAKDAATTFGGSGPKLTSADRFERAAREVGLGGTTSGFAYVDVRGLAPLLRSVLASLGGSSSGSTRDGLEALSAFDTVAVVATADGSRTRLATVVRVG